VQAPLFALAAAAHGWALYVLMIAFMVAIFGAIPFTDAMIVRYVDDSHRSRVSGMRLTVALGASSLGVWLLGPAVKAAGFGVLLLVMAALALCTLAAVLFLPRPQALPTGRAASSASRSGLNSPGAAAMTSSVRK
jgi:predicted MFS family arabinose efflux permease